MLNAQSDYIATMNSTVCKFYKRLVCLTLAVSTFSALANADLGPYQEIVKRNPFGLNPPTPPPVVAPPVVAPPVDITLTGITDLFGPAKAYLTTKDSAGKPEHHSLSVGERSGGLEVLGIDSTAGTVKVRNGRLETVLNFKDHGAKAVAAAAPPAPGAPGQPRPGGPPGFSAPGTPGAAPTTISGRPPVTGVPAPSGATGFTAAQPGGTISVGTGQNSATLIAIPTRNTRTSTSPQETTVPHPPQPNLSAEQSAVIMAVTKEANKAEIQQGKFPPLPPVPGVDE